MHRLGLAVALASYPTPPYLSLCCSLLKCMRVGRTGDGRQRRLRRALEQRLGVEAHVEREHLRVRLAAALRRVHYGVRHLQQSGT